MDEAKKKTKRGPEWASEEASSERLRKIKRAKPSSNQKKHKKFGTSRQTPNGEEEKLPARVVVEKTNAASKILLTEGEGYLEAQGLGRTWKFTQAQIQENVDIQTQRKVFDLDLQQFAPYRIDYSRNGRHLLVGGKMGHLALLDWENFSLVSETHLKETVRDVKFLHNHTMFATAQKKYVYIYDAQGIELHRLDFEEPTRLEFLPYHFLLACVSKRPFLRYQDVSTGNTIAQHRTRMGPCEVMKQNPHNAVLCLGHQSGTVSMWSPNMAQPLVKMFCHRGAVTALAVDPHGHHMVTTGHDGLVKVWDLRTYNKLHEYRTIRVPNAVEISQTGLLSVAAGPHIQIWKDALIKKAKDPYLTHHVYGQEIVDVGFCPYQDVLGIGHTGGFSSIVVPGSGLANFDSTVADPFENNRQRRENEVKALLDKVPATMIALDPTNVARIDTASKEILDAEKKERETEVAEAKSNKGAAQGEISKAKLKRLRRKKANIIDQETKTKKEAASRKKYEEQILSKNKKKSKGAQNEEVPVKSALDRFFH